MENYLNIQQEEVAGTTTDKVAAATGYAVLLEALNCVYTKSGFYLVVGEVKSAYEWELYVSVIPAQLPQILKKLCPVINAAGISFKIPANQEIAEQMNAGFLGHTQFGKIISIQVTTWEQAVTVADELVLLTEQVDGPDIFAAVHLGGRVYTDYVATGSIRISKDLVSGELFLPVDLQWPFSTIRELPERTGNKKMNAKYCPVEILKNDVKGRVLIGETSEGGEKGRYVIKEGRRFLCMDGSGRDVTDRLRWQYTLHNVLESKIRIPKAFVLFEEAASLYMVMELIPGRPFSDVIDELHQGQSWATMPTAYKNQLIKYLLTIIDMVGKLHAEGFIHRDLQPRNFMIGNDHQVTCMDLEMVYNLKEGVPDPPFTLGTPGYMSPEQYRVETPTVAQDVFSLGALIIRVITGLSPKLLSVSNHRAISRQVSFLIPDEQVVELVKACLHPSPDQRPTVKHVHRVLRRYNRRMTTVQFMQYVKQASFDDELLDKTIRRAIRGLASTALVSSNGLWFSKPLLTVEQLANENAEAGIYHGLHTGICGVLYSLLQAAKLGQNVDECGKVIQDNLMRILAHLFEEQDNHIPGLYYGNYGISTLLSLGIRTGWVQMVPEITELIYKGLSLETQSLGILEGKAGLGIAIMNCRDIIGEKRADDLLDLVVDQLLSAQQKDGAWLMDMAKTNVRQDKVYGFSLGIAGIIFFLLKYYQTVKDSKILQSAERGLLYLNECATKNEGKVYWGLFDGDQSKDPWLEWGNVGIVMAFIEGYRITGKEIYKQTVEGALANHPAKIVCPYFSLGGGLAGLGSVYLKAFRVLGTEQWLKRAEWIAELLMHTNISLENRAVYWIADNTLSPTADFMTGNAGILYFLLQLQYQNESEYPIFL